MITQCIIVKKKFVKANKGKKNNKMPSHGDQRTTFKINTINKQIVPGPSSSIMTSLTLVYPLLFQDRRSVKFLGIVVSSEIVQCCHCLYIVGRCTKPLMDIALASRSLYTQNLIHDMHRTMMSE